MLGEIRRSSWLASGAAIVMLVLESGTGLAAQLTYDFQGRVTSVGFDQLGLLSGINSTRVVNGRFSYETNPAAYTVSVNSQNTSYKIGGPGNTVFIELSIVGRPQTFHTAATALRTIIVANDFGEPPIDTMSINVDKITEYPAYSAAFFVDFSDEFATIWDDESLPTSLDHMDIVDFAGGAVVLIDLGTNRLSNFSFRIDTLTLVPEPSVSGLATTGFASLLSFA